MPRKSWAGVFEKARRFALSLPDVEEGTSYGTPALKVNGRLFARLRPDLESLVLLTSFESRAKMISAKPRAYYITDHYLNYPWVLARLSDASIQELRDLILTARELAASTSGRSSRADARFIRQMRAAPRP